MQILLVVIEGEHRREFDITEDADSLCFTKAVIRNQRHFTVVEQDVTAPATIQFWSSIQPEGSSKKRKALIDAIHFANSATPKKYAD